LIIPDTVGFIPHWRQGNGLIVSFGAPELDRPRWHSCARGGRGYTMSPFLQPWVARGSGPSTPWCVEAGGGLARVIHRPQRLGGLQDALPEERETSPPIALALHQFQAMDVAFGDTVAPL
jgi:hypothetical protein